jgi:hypothetical protein
LKTTLFNDTNKQAGYLLWAPRFHNAGGQVTHGREQYYNVFAFAGDVNQRPLNTAIPPRGVEEKFVDVRNSRETRASSVFGDGVSFADSAAENSTASPPDPAAMLLSGAFGSSIVMDARTLSACLRLTYTGRMDASSGEVAFVENLSVSNLIGDTGSDSAGLTMTVDELFQISTSTQRLGVDTLEIVHRGHEVHAATFTDYRDSALLNDSFQGNTPSAPTIASNKAESPHVFGFAWRGLDTPGNNASLTFNLLKNIEWRPEVRTGFTSITPHTVNTENVLAQVHKALDNNNPSWTRRIIDSAASLAGEVVKMAKTGVSAFATRQSRQIMSQLGRGAMRMLL